MPWSKPNAVIVSGFGEIITAASDGNLLEDVPYLEHDAIEAVTTLIRDAWVDERRAS